MNGKVKILIGVFLFYVFENLYFGCNLHALSSAEGFCDMLVIFGMWLALLWSDKK